MRPGGLLSAGSINRRPRAYPLDPRRIRNVVRAFAALLVLSVGWIGAASCARADNGATSQLLAFVHAADAGDRATAATIADGLLPALARENPAMAPVQRAELLLEIAVRLAALGDPVRARAAMAQASVIVDAALGAKGAEAVEFRLKAASAFAEAGVAGLALEHARAVEQGAASAYERRPEAEARILAAVGDIYQKMSQPADRARIMARLEELNGATDIRARPTVTQRDLRNDQKHGAADFNDRQDRNRLVDVFYGTNWEVASAEGEPLRYGGRRGPLKLGVVTVSIPPAHEPGELEEPQWFKLEFHADPSKYVVVSNINALASTEFLAQLRARVQKGAHKDALVFIHGYNNSFEDAAMRAAQLAYDLEFDGAPILYSWPSRGKLLDYLQDANEVIRPTLHDLSGFLEDVVAQSGAEHVYVIAHSMGNRFLLGAFEEMIHSREKAGKSAAPIFEEVIFAAPDVDADNFRASVADFKPWLGHLTLYASRNDLALQFSKQFNDYSRAGDTTPIIVLDGLFTVDASDMRADWMGHAYFAAGALADLRALLWLHLPPAKRCPLEERSLGAGSFWAFNANRCDVDGFQIAMRLLHRHGSEQARRTLDEWAKAATAETRSTYVAARAQLEAIAKP